jgi:hypothetical protein
MMMPAEVDCNSPAFWRDGELFLLNSTGLSPALSRGRNQRRLEVDRSVTIIGNRIGPTWIEAVFTEPNGTMLGWYHEEDEFVCGTQRPAQPRIGALISYDDGWTWEDLGVVLSSGVGADCSSKNGYISGGHGDFSVVLDPQSRYFYFLFSNYGGPDSTQGVAVARMQYEDRYRPAGKVWKYFNGDWRRNGLGGDMTPIFPAVVNWQRAETDSFWGPSVHWNTYLRSWVMLLNRSCCWPGYPQEGIYVSYNPDLGNPGGWSTPQKIIDGTWWYPQVLGLGPGGTDSLAGQRARLYIFGSSQWELIFRRSGDEPSAEGQEVVSPPRRTPGLTGRESVGVELDR